MTVITCLWLGWVSSVGLAERWPVEKVNVIEHRLSGFLNTAPSVVLLIVISVNCIRNKCQRGAKDSQAQPLKVSSILLLLWTEWAAFGTVRIIQRRCKHYRKHCQDRFEATGVRNVSHWVKPFVILLSFERMPQGDGGWQVTFPWTSSCEMYLYTRVQC